MQASDHLFAPLLAIGLLAPGWLLGRALNTPASVTTMFLGSCALLMNTVLMLDALAIPLTRASCAVALGGVSVVLAAVAWRRPRSPGGVPASSATRIFDGGTGRGRPVTWLLLLPAALGFAAIVVRAGLDPLSGYDNIFRWDFLARQMLREGSLDFYPAVTAADFLRYGWCDGIAPLVSSLYFWAYASLGEAVAWATIPVVLAQAALIFLVTYQLAAGRANPVAGYIACAVLATSATLLWGIAMGQETGLTVLSLLAMFLFIERHRERPDVRWLAWAGLAAGVGALAREYGLVLVVLGAVALLLQSTARRGWFQFLGAAALVALPWYLRNVIKTGHPLYNHDFLFPVNPVGAEYLRTVAEFTSISRHPESLLVLGGLALALAGTPLVGGLIAGGMRRRERPAWLLALIVVIGLWLWSVGQTSGGAAYSLRVLTPAIGLGAVLTGQVLGPVVMRRSGRLLALVLALVAVDAAVRSLYLPALPRISWWQHPPALWREVSQFPAEAWKDRIWRDLTEAANGRKLVVSEPVSHALLVQQGALPVPLFSPEVRFLFDPGLTLPAGLVRLRAAGVRFVLLARGNTVIDAQTARYPFFRALRAMPPTMRILNYDIYDLDTPPSAIPPPPLAP